MPRVPRLVISDPGQKSIYHVISRTALDGLPFKKVEKDELVRVIMLFSAIYFVKVFGYAIMGNHFHLLVELSPGALLSDNNRITGDNNRGQVNYAGPQNHDMRYSFQACHPF